MTFGFRLHTSTRRQLLAITCASLLPTLAIAQAPVQRTLGPREAVGTETFSQVRGFRELSDGRVLVTDQREQKIVLLDLKAGTATPIGRTGSGPAEFQTPTDLLPAPGDTTLLIDVFRGVDAFSVITPSGQLIAAAKRLPEGRTSSYIFGADGNGMLYFPERVIRINDAPGPDSAAVFRVDLRRGTSAPAFHIRRQKTEPNAPRDPYNSRDQWAVGPDGHIAIVHVADYRVTWIAPDGKRTTGQPIPFEVLSFTQRDEDEFRDLARRVGGLGQAGASMGGRANAPPTPDFPARKPAFFGNHAAMIAPNGELWVRRTQRAGEKMPLHDIIDRSGKRVATISLPAETRLLALGTHGVYLARWDEDDLIHIERYRYPRAP